MTNTDSDTQFAHICKICIENAGGVATIDVFINVYIRCGNTRYFLDVDDDNYALVLLYNI